MAAGVLKDRRVQIGRVIGRQHDWTYMLEVRSVLDLNAHERRNEEDETRFNEAVVGAAQKGWLT
jgi:hypothetical protein